MSRQALSAPEVPVDIFAVRLPGTIWHGSLFGCPLVSISYCTLQISGVQGKVVAAGAGVAAAVAGIFGFRKNNDSEPSLNPNPSVAEPEPIDITIPYDAAARLEFTAWLATHPDAANSEDTFAKFKPLYEAKAVAEVTVKKQTRDLALAQETATAAAKALDEL